MSLRMKLMAVLAGVAALAFVAPSAASAEPIRTLNPWFNIRVEHTGKCLDVQGVSAQDGAVTQQWTCLGPNQHNQHWTPVSI